MKIKTEKKYLKHLVKKIKQNKKERRRMSRGKKVEEQAIQKEKNRDGGGFIQPDMKSYEAIVIKKSVLLMQDPQIHE